MFNNIVDGVCRKNMKIQKSMEKALRGKKRQTKEAINASAT